ncbi:MAG: hypothetical protein A3K60_06050 [Euryarchaeota archaeon RBG_19FT_COMBO_56_21]|nr:MAG: hypothetical protein A3K60_06050 [Euryarchaeota archaeon RBG_19FT_COMBO_56_21]
MASKKFDDLNEEMLKEYLKINPDIATGMGIHVPYDWQLPNGGFKKLEDTRNLLTFWHTKVKELESSEELSLEQKISIKNLKYAIDFHEFSLVDYPHWKMNPNAIDMPGALFFIMLTRDYAPFDQRVSAINSRLMRLPKYLKEYESRFQDAKPVKEWTRMAITSTEQFPGFLKFIEEAARGKVHESLMEDLTKSVRAAEAAVKEHLDWLNKLPDKPGIKFAMGKRKFSKLMKMRGFGLTPEAILGLGEKYLKEFKEERERVAERIAPGKGIEGATEIVRSHCGKTFEDALKMTEDEMNNAKKFIVDHNLATIDHGAKLMIVETPSFMARLLPYAALFMPAMFDKVQEGAYIVTRPKDPKDLGSHLNHAAIVNTAVHEAYPGHFHQGVASNKKHWMLQIAGGADADIVGVATETVEGWAHYCEQMMINHGFEATNEAAFEMLNGAIWRACRIVADVKLAQGEATIQEMADWIVKETGMAQGATEDEVRRYSQTPGQALSYMIGRHLILDLRKDMENKLGSRFDEKRFHDLVAGYGYLPFPLMKEAVTSELGI